MDGNKEALSTFQITVSLFDDMLMWDKVLSNHHKLTLHTMNKYIKADHETLFNWFRIIFLNEKKNYNVISILWLYYQTIAQRIIAWIY